MYNSRRSTQLSALTGNDVGGMIEEVRVSERMQCLLYSISLIVLLQPRFAMLIYTSSNETYLIEPNAIIQ